MHMVANHISSVMRMQNGYWHFDGPSPVRIQMAQLVCHFNQHVSWHFNLIVEDMVVH